MNRCKVLMNPFAGTKDLPSLWIACCVEPFNGPTNSTSHNSGPIFQTPIRRSFRRNPPPHRPRANSKYPACGQTFRDDYQDEYCPSGAELQPRTSMDGNRPGPTRPESPEVSPPPVVIPTSASPSSSTRPPVRRFVLSSIPKRSPAFPYIIFPLRKTFC